MKRIHLKLCLVAIVLLSGFSVEPLDHDISKYKPILLDKADLTSSVFVEQPRSFSRPGKIYLYGEVILIVDRYTGIHIIDNSDPFAPSNIGFIRIPGVMDVAVKDSILYADNAIDLVAIDLKRLDKPSVITRVENVFPEHRPPDLDWIPWIYSPENRPKNTVIVSWVK